MLVSMYQATPHLNIHRHENLISRRHDAVCSDVVCSHMKGNEPPFTSVLSHTYRDADS
jgi:hypothetical protein